MISETPQARELVKHILNEINKITPFEVITRKPVIPSDDEITLNGRARSAKLRVAQKI